MNRNFGIGILILCFGSSSVNAAWATEVVEVPPIVVQANDLSEISQQMLEQDRINRDQELAIRGLIDDNQRLADTALARQQDATLEKINQTMIDYRDSLLYRDRERIMANGERASKYYDLIHLTEDVDDMKDGQALLLKRDVIEQKYKILTELKDEMTALNAKLREEAAHENSDKINQQQEDKIQLLTQRLGEMDQRIAHYDAILAEKDQQIAQLKDDLARIQNEASAQEQMIKEQKNQINILQGQTKGLSSPSQDSVALAPIVVTPVDQNAVPANIQAEFTALRNTILQQSRDLNLKNESIRWLKQVLAVAKDKAEYYRLSSQKDRLPMQQVQAEVQNMKDDFARHLKEYDQFENAIVSLKGQVSQLGLQLSQAKNQNQQEVRVEQDLRAQLQDKENQIVQMKTNIKTILQAQANKEIYRHNASAQSDDRIGLAKQLIGLQQQETSLLDEKDNLEEDQNALFDRHVLAYENRIKELLVKHRIQAADLKNYMQELKNELDQKQQQVDLLKEELENKITEAKDQDVLAGQIRDLKAQVQDKEDQIVTMNKNIQAGQESKEEADSLKQQLAAEQDKTNQLKQQLDSKIAESDKMTLMMGDYQKKLESRNSAYNEQLGQVLSFKNYQAQMEKQIDDLNVRLQEKEAQVVRIKKDMYDLQELANTKDRNVQAKDLSLSMIQQKTMDGRINEYKDRINGLQATDDKQAQEVVSLKTELALARQQLNGMPSSDELDFLRTGLKKATVELKQKDEMLSQIKANADEYAKEFKAQTLEFQSLKDQLQNAYDDLHNRNEDLKYKNLEIIRLKERSAMSQGDLQEQVRVLTRKLDAAHGRTISRHHESKVEVLQDQLNNADLQIKDLQAHLDQLESSSKNDLYERKLKQALDKIDEQGRVLNVLIRKLQAAGQDVDLTKIVHSESGDYFKDGVAK